MPTMGNYWAKQGWRVILLTTSPPGDSHFYELDPAIIHRHVHLQVERNYNGEELITVRAKVAKRTHLLIEHLRRTGGSA